MFRLTAPTLLLDREKCHRNIARMADKARASRVGFRPHFKTHQSHEIGRWFRAAGVEQITVSSLQMAQYFAADSWQDITVAFPLNVHEIERVNALAENVQLNLLIVAPETVAQLAKNLKFKVDLLIEIDCGDHRTGLNPADIPGIENILAEIRRHDLLRFKGFLTHAGQSYGVKSDQKEIARVYRESLAAVLPLKEKYAAQFPDLILSYGDTPTCSVIEDFTGLDELRPGNLAFYDLTQVEIGACSREQIAVAMACPVVAKNPDRNEIVIYGGAVHLSKDFMLLPDGRRCYGKLVTLTDDGWETRETGAFLKSLSQEHGVIDAPRDYFESVKLGDFVGVLPVHSCLTADLMSSYLTLEGERIGKFRYEN